MDETARPSSDDPLVPKTIGRYQVQQSVGYGAMGAVYKAFDPLIKRTLAIKTIRLDIARQSPQYKSFIERFYHEARISGTLSHPNIVTLFDIGEEAGVPYLAMEFVEGETLSSFLERGNRFPPEKVIGLISQIASALDYAHSKGVIHRDVKPSNLILYEGERIKVTDFGIAKLVDTEITHSGTLLGTPSYMSPEQAMGDKLDGRSDIFSLGVCAFEMLSGEQPFPGTNVTSILYKLVHVDPVEPANLEMNGLVPQKWHEVFGRVLAKRPDDRYQTATDFVQDLEYCLGAWFGAMGDDPFSEIGGPAVEDPQPALGGPAAGRTDDSTASYPVFPAPPPQAPSFSPDAPPNDTLPPAGEEPAPPTVVLSTAPATILMKPAAVSAATPKTSASSDVTLKTVPPPPTVRAPAPTFAQAAPTATAPRPAGLGDDATREVAVHTVGVPARRRPSRKVPTGVILGLAGLVTLAAIGLGVAALYRRLSAPAPPAPAAAGASPSTLAPAPARGVDPAATAAAPIGVVHVETEPPGASVTVDGQPRGVTPLDVPGLDFGSHAVKVELKGYEPRDQGVMLTLAAPRSEVKLPLTKSAAATGSADILSSPTAAAVIVNGATVGYTPLTNWKLRPGTHKVRIEKDGYEAWSGTVSVQPGKRARLDVPLNAIPKPAPQPTPEAVDPARIYEVGDVDVRPRKVSGEWAAAPKLKSGERISVGGTFVVTDSGEVTDVRVTESAGKVLDENVASALRKWKYTPGTKRGVKVKVRLPFKQTFTTG